MALLLTGVLERAGAGRVRPLARCISWPGAPAVLGGAGSVSSPCECVHTTAKAVGDLELDPRGLAACPASQMKMEFVSF